MAKQRTEASPFKSRFAPDTWISATQMLSEGMCDRKARKMKVALPAYFWDKKVSPTWHREFLLQSRHAASLLKIYSIEAILAGLRRPEARNAFSLGAKWLDSYIAEEQRRLDAVQAKQESRLASTPDIQEAPRVAEPPRPTFTSSKSTLSKLRELDG